MRSTSSAIAAEPIPYKNEMQQSKVPTCEKNLSKLGIKWKSFNQITGMDKEPVPTIIILVKKLNNFFL